MASVLKTDEGNSSMSSNLIPTANLSTTCNTAKLQLYIITMKERRHCAFFYFKHAGVVELADTRDLKSRDGNIVPVRSRSPAPIT